jgi:opacity protein-like surface antigen
MKKIALIAATTALLSSTALAVSTPDTFYVRGDVGVNMTNGITDKSTDLKLKSKVAPIFNVGVGYNVQDNMRADLTFTYTNPELKKSGTASVSSQYSGHSVSIKHKGTAYALLLNGYVDNIVQAGDFGLFAGAGVGMSQLKEKISLTDSTMSAWSGSVSTKKASNFAYQLTAGGTYDFGNSMKGELAYSWRDFGKTKSLSPADWGYNLSKTVYRGNNLTLGIRADL